MKKLWILCFVLALASCSDVVHTGADKQGISVVYTREVPENCEEVGVLATSCGDMKECVADFKSYTQDLEGNTVKIVDWTEYSFGWNKMRMKGAAYRCP